MQAGWRRQMSTWTSPAHRRNSGDLVSAVSTASTGQERHPQDASLAAQHIALATELAEKAAAAKEWTKAAWHWQSVVDAYSGRQPPASAYLGLVRAHRSQGDFASARTIASSARSAYPHDTCLIKEHDEIESGYAEFACDLSQAIADTRDPADPSADFDQFDTAMLDLLSRVGQIASPYDVDALEGVLKAVLANDFGVACLVSVKVEAIKEDRCKPCRKYTLGLMQGRSRTAGRARRHGS